VALSPAEANMNQALVRLEQYRTTQVYARIYDETLYEQFKTAMSRLEAIAVDDWPGVDSVEPAFSENWTGGPAWRFNVANSVRFG
jgi:hypothetical protein